MPKETFETIVVDDRNYVVKKKKRTTGYFMENGDRHVLIPQPNFRGTGMSLCGALKENQTLEQFIDNYKSKKSKKA